MTIGQRETVEAAGARGGGGTTSPDDLLLLGRVASVSVSVIPQSSPFFVFPFPRYHRSRVSRTNIPLPIELLYYTLNRCSCQGLAVRVKVLPFVYTSCEFGGYSGISFRSVWKKKKLAHSPQHNRWSQMDYKRRYPRSNNNKKALNLFLITILKTPTISTVVAYLQIGCQRSSCDATLSNTTTPSFLSSWAILHKIAKRVFRRLATPW